MNDIALHDHQNSTLLQLHHIVPQLSPQYQGEHLITNNCDDDNDNYVLEDTLVMHFQQSQKQKTVNYLAEHAGQAAI